MTDPVRRMVYDMEVSHSVQHAKEALLIALALVASPPGARVPGGTAAQPAHSLKAPEALVAVPARRDERRELAHRHAPARGGARADGWAR